MQTTQYLVLNNETKQRYGNITLPSPPQDALKYVILGQIRLLILLFALILWLPLGIAFVDNFALMVENLHISLNVSAKLSTNVISHGN